MERSLGGPTLEHQAYSERKAEPGTGTYSKPLGFQQAATSVTAIQGNSVVCTQKSEIQDSKCSWKTEEEPGIDNESERSGSKVLEKVFQLAWLHLKDVVVPRQ